MTEDKTDPTSDAARSDPAVADKEREKLRKAAEDGLRDSKGKLPKDEV
ncbi:hypothetical protein [Neorhizobium alkalisoli]|jgi:hypothetical protein|uniref:Uncharacterized protein n=1 Tax=Neorhizobium alkalisoli TaxID=528178 RepID=A0A561QBQ9_9HYPH|nr:hypothetical protein [Neorhizobium alkalisoli]TWF47805.1 hypothetical protein FHW37_110102 [Neorhizobium alkalisoli]